MLSLLCNNAVAIITSCVVCTAVSIFSYYYGSTVFKCCKEKYRKIKTNATTAIILRAISNSTTENNSQCRFEINNDRRSATITYTHNGQTHIVIVPYNRRHIRSMSQHQVHLVKGEDTINITHQPGIPYLVTAEELGGDSIVIMNENGNIIKKLDKRSIPQID